LSAPIKILTCPWNQDKPDMMIGKSTHMIWLIDLISMRDSKTVILVEHYHPDINVLLAIMLWKSLGKGYGEVIEGRDCMLRETQSRVLDQPEDV
jgi:hypothetical protein